jgi:hypothetical protein
MKITCTYCLDDTSVPVSALPSQSYFSDHGNSEATDDDVTQSQPIIYSQCICLSFHCVLEDG